MRSFFISSHSRVEGLPSNPDRATKLVVWNHDDLPLKSDVVQQAVNLARVQHYLGSQSGIE